MIRAETSKKRVGKRKKAKEILQEDDEFKEEEPW